MNGTKVVQARGRECDLLTEGVSFAILLDMGELLSAPVTLIHVGKTGGSAFKYVIERQSERTGVVPILVWRSRHDMTFPRLCTWHPTMRAVFFIRDPADRFVSGFNARLRRGRPRRDVPWSFDEARAFSTFRSANALAEALGDPARREAAEHAMRSIVHVREPLVYFLGSVQFLARHQDRIFYIGDVRTLDRDVDILKRLLGIDADISLPADDHVEANRASPDMDRHLSAMAVSNLQAWYSADYEVYRWCQEARLQYSLPTVFQISDEARTLPLSSE